MHSLLQYLKSLARPAALLAVGACALAGCSAERDPSFEFRVKGASEANIEAVTSSPRTQDLMKRAIADALSDSPWSGATMVSVAPGVGDAEWQSRIGAVISVIKPLQDGEFKVAGHEVSLTGSVSGASPEALQQALQEIFGPSYKLMVSVTPLRETTAEAEESTTVDPSAPSHRWVVTVSVPKYDDEPGEGETGFVWDMKSLPPVALASNKGGTFAIREGVTCTVSPVFRRVQGDASYRTVQYLRKIDCPGVEITGGMFGQAEGNLGGCYYPQGEPIAAGAKQEFGWSMRRGRRLEGKLDMSCTVVGEPAP